MKFCVHRILEMKVSCGEKKNRMYESYKEQKFYCVGVVVYNGDHADYTNCNEVDVARKNVEKLLWQRKYIVLEAE